jgi:hypothetical protein
MGHQPMMPVNSTSGVRNDDKLRNPDPTAIATNALIPG